MFSKNQRVAVISLRFKPAFVSHMAAFGKALRELGCSVEFLVTSEYAGFEELMAIGSVTTDFGRSDQERFSHAIFVNVSTLNRRIALKLKSRGTKILYVYHEPWFPSLNYFLGEGIKGGMMGALAHRLSVSMLKLADGVILASRYAESVYRNGDIKFNRRYTYVPLLFDDEVAQDSLNCERKQYVSYIGGICRAHGFDQYVAFMRNCLIDGENFKFMIASTLPLPPYVLKDKVIKRHLDKIRILCGRPLTNVEINSCYADSLCVWNMYRRSTQSGVLPKAFMFGTPVIAATAGAFPEFIKERVNGAFACPRDTKAIKAAVAHIQDNIHDYVTGCRNTFLATFHYRAQMSQLQRLLAVPEESKVSSLSRGYVHMGETAIQLQQDRI